MREREILKIILALSPLGFARLVKKRRKKKRREDR